MNKTINFIVLTCLILSFQSVTAQSIRKELQTKYDKLEKELIEGQGITLGKNTLTTLELKFTEPYVGVFKNNGKLMGRYSPLEVSINDSFLIRTVLWPNMYYKVSLPESDIEYKEIDMVVKDQLLKNVEFDTHIKALKKLKLKSLFPLGNLLYCKQDSDESSEYKREKSSFKTDRGLITFNLERINENIEFKINLNASYLGEEDLKILGCSIPNESKVKFTFMDDTSLELISNDEEENCYNFTSNITNKLDRLSKEVKHLEITLSKKSALFTVDDEVEAKNILIKLDCIR